MNRRRFIPSSEGLESRALLASSPNLSSLFGFQVNTNLNIPVTFEQKALRVEHLPYYLEKILPGRFLPATEIKEIQGGLMQMISHLHKPATSALDNYNYELRQIVPHQSLTPAGAAVLNYSFGAVLHAASASPSVIDGLKSSVNQLVTQVDTNSPQPVFLASNDYALILQTALSIGRPMPAPILPKIAAKQGVQANASHIKTPLKHPALVGTYHFHTHIQIITPGGEVVGTTNCRPNGRYKVLINPALSPGVYQFRIRAYDDAGDLSRVSRIFEIKVVAKEQPAK